MPTIEELRFDNRARAEGRAKAAALPEAHLVKLVNVQREECERSTSKMREQWAESWSYYQSEVDYSDKEDWQSAVWIPKPWVAVEQAATRLQEGINQSPEYFRIEGVDDNDKLLADQIWNPVIKFALAKSSFIPKFIDAAKVSLATGISHYLKFRYPSVPSPILDSVQLDPTTGAVYPQYRMQRQSALTVETVAPWKIYRDPASRPREQWSGGYIIHEDFVDRAVLASAAAANIYQNIEAVVQSAGTRGDDQNQASTDEAHRKGMTWEPHAFRKPVLCSEWYGDVLDENGDCVFPDAHMILANRQNCIYGPKDNPLWAVDQRTFRRKWPLIAFSPLSHPMRFEGWGILHAVTPLAVIFSNLYNLFMDGMNWLVNQPTELNLNLLDDDDDRENIPGKMWPKIGDGQLLSPAQMGRMDAGSVLAALQFNENQWENNSFVNNFVTGNMPGRQMTRGEVQTRTVQSVGMLQGMGENIEEGGVACLELAFDFLLQYMTDWTSPSVADIVGPARAAYLTMIDPAQRIKQLSGQFNYQFTGVTAALRKSDLLGRLLQASALAAQGPYAGYTNPAEMLAAIIEALGVADKVSVAKEKMIPLSQVQQFLASLPPGMPGALPGARPALPSRMPTMREMAPTPTDMAMAEGGM
jgi:hypothetical protein